MQEQKKKAAAEAEQAVKAAPAMTSETKDSPSANE